MNKRETKRLYNKAKRRRHLPYPNLIGLVAARAKLTRGTVLDVVANLVAVIEDATTHGTVVRIPHFGQFRVKKLLGKPCRDFSGASFHSRDKNTLRFRPEGPMRDMTWVEGAGDGQQAG